MTRQQRAREREAALREQLSGYQRMRRQHQKQLLGLENRLRAELADHQLRLDRELENQRLAAAAEADKLARRHQAIFEKEVGGAKGGWEGLGRAGLGGRGLGGWVGLGSIIPENVEVGGRQRDIF